VVEVYTRGRTKGSEENQRRAPKEKARQNGALSSHGAAKFAFPRATSMF
jgi:hypothetical protein